MDLTFAARLLKIVFMTFPVFLLILTTLAETGAARKWHWGVRIAGLVVLVLAALAEGITIVLWIGGVLFAAGYAGLILGRPPEAATAGMGAGVGGWRALRENMRIDSRFALNSAVVIGACVLLLELVHFVFFASLQRTGLLFVIVSSMVSLPLFVAVCAFPFAVYALWRQPWHIVNRIVATVLLLIYASAFVVGFWPWALLMHAA